MDRTKLCFSLHNFSSRESVKKLYMLNARTQYNHLFQISFTRQEDITTVSNIILMTRFDLEKVMNPAYIIIRLQHIAIDYLTVNP